MKHTQTEEAHVELSDPGDQSRELLEHPSSPGPTLIGVYSRCKKHDVFDMYGSPIDTYLNFVSRGLHIHGEQVDMEVISRLLYV